MKLTTRDIVYIALYAALFVVLDYLTNLFNLFRMPQGGSLSFATVALLVASYHLGWKKGLLVCVVSIILMWVIGSITYYGIVSLLFDYIIGYLAYGLASLVPSYKAVHFGIIVSNLIRLAASTFAGCYVWGSELPASLSYNAGYIVPTMIADLILVPLVLMAIEPVIKRRK
ncbi:MAG: energy-coupled thiamine transporter ThiT [Erysipelotrichaceae bacterium]|nr:energy-coupled thiamine transporter ThiT [Erysipelotrichaceae bacterium]MBR5048518.1 energy-coupled thiamine transporter ThiT [Erysipelotrichaceae bacterium]